MYVPPWKIQRKKFEIHSMLKKAKVPVLVKLDSTRKQPDAIETKQVVQVLSHFKYKCPG